MALARVKTWNPGDVLTAADLNGEFNNVLNNPISLVSPTTGPVNFNLQAHTNLVPTAITASSGTGGQILTISSSAAAVWTGVPAGSRVRGLAGTLSSQQGTFTANQYLLQTTDGKGSFILNSTGAFTVNLGTAGPTANGRDIAGSFASTYVHWYCITTGMGSTAVAGLVSTNPPSAGPVALPTGYSAWAYLGASPYSSASTTLGSLHRFRGSWAYYEAEISQVSGANPSTGVVTSGSLAANVPDNATLIDLSVASKPSATNSGTFTFTIGFTSSVAARNFNSIQVANTNIWAGGSVHIPNNSQQFYYSGNGPVGLVNSIDINVAGYQMPNGDV